MENAFSGKRIKSVLVLFCAAGFAGCVFTTEIKSYSPLQGNEDAHLGTMKVPRKMAMKFQDAAKGIIEIIYSDEFKTELKKYTEIHRNSTEAFSKEWKDWDAEKIIKMMKDSIKGLQLKIYKGPIACFKHYVYHNVAFDGAKNGPILMNRWGLASFGPDDIANSMSHEAAHRIGLQHPDYADDHKIGLCEPPYVIGGIVQRLYARKYGLKWKWDGDNYCKHMEVK